MGQQVSTFDRHPVVANRFYPGDASALAYQVNQYLAMAPKKRQEQTLLAMVPHAGYPYSGPVAGVTLGQARLAETLILLGPNHTGHGAPLAVWPKGHWLTPGCAMSVNESLAGSLVASCPQFTLDRSAHLEEHSLEVLLPFLCRLDGDKSILPVCVAEPSFDHLQQAAQAMAKVLISSQQHVSLVVSSDMSHYVSHQQAKSLDTLALACILKLDALALYETVRSRNISMCGVLPMTLGLLLAKSMGATKAELTAYATSGDASGDYDQVVGYAGVIVS